MLGQRIDHRDADAVQAAGHLVGVLVELTAGMQLGHDDLGRRHALFLVDVDRDAAAVVAHRDRAVAVQQHVDAVAEAGEGFVDRVVDHLVDHVMQAGAVVGVADIHARALAHGIEALQDLDRIARRSSRHRRRSELRRNIVLVVRHRALTQCHRLENAGISRGCGRGRPRPRKTAPGRRAGGTARGSVPVSQACRPRARISPNNASRRWPSRCDTASSSSRIGACPRRRLVRRASASAIDSSSARCSPVEHSAARSGALPRARPR